MIRAQGDEAPLFRASNVMIVEGIDDAHAFEVMLDKLGRKMDLEIFVANGKENIRPTLRILFGYSGFAQLKRIILVRDADNDPAGAFASCADSLSVIGLTRPLGLNKLSLTSGKPSGLIWLTPMAGQGCLESICFESLAKATITTCIESYLRCVDATYGSVPTVFNAADESKRRTESVLAAGRLGETKDPPGLRLGIGISRGIFDMNAPSFEPYLDGLRGLP